MNFLYTIHPKRATKYVGQYCSLFSVNKGNTLNRQREPYKIRIRS